MVVANGEAMSNILPDGTEVPSHNLAQRFKRFEPGATPGSMDADALGIVVVNGNEDRDLPFG